MKMIIMIITIIIIIIKNKTQDKIVLRQDFADVEYHFNILRRGLLPHL